MAELTPDELNEKLRETASLVEDTFRSVAAHIKDLYKEAFSDADSYTKDSIKNVEKQLSKMADMNRDTFEYQAKKERGLLNAKDIEKDILDYDIEREVIEKRIAQLQAQASDPDSDMTSEQAQHVKDMSRHFRDIVEQNDEWVESLKIQLGEIEKIEKKVGVIEKLFLGIKQIPVLGAMLNVDEAIAKMEKLAHRGKPVQDQAGNVTYQKQNQMQIVGAGITEAMSGLKELVSLASIFLTVVKTISFFVKAMFEADKQATLLAKSLSVSKEEARQLKDYYDEQRVILKSQYGLTQELVETHKQLSELSSATLLFSISSLDAQIQLTKEYGLSVEESSKLVQNLMMSSTEGTRGLSVIMEQVAQYANQNKILFNGKKILSEISKVSGQILASFKGNTAELANAVLKSEQLGITLGKSRDIGNSLLNFESSIESELEAELLTGRQLNLEKARALAMQGKYADLAQEISDSALDYNEYSELWPIQQEALAKALGMQADELANVLYTQKFIGDEGKKQIQRMREAKMESQANAMASGKLKGEELEQALKSLDAQEKFNIALDKAKNIFTDLVDGGYLDSLSNTLMSITDSLATFFGGKTAEEYKIDNQVKELNIKLQETSDPLEKQKIKTQIDSIDPTPYPELRYNNPELHDLIKQRRKEWGEKPTTKPTNYNDEQRDQISSLIEINKKMLVALVEGKNIYLDGQKLTTAMSMGHNNQA